MLEANENYDEKFEYNPKISILVPVYNVLDRHLIPCIESVLNQVYTIGSFVWLMTVLHGIV